MPAADLGERRRQRDERIGARRAWLHLHRHGLVSADTARGLGLTADDIRRLRRWSS